MASNRIIISPKWKIYRTEDNDPYATSNDAGRYALSSLEHDMVDKIEALLKRVSDLEQMVECENSTLLSK